MRLETLSHKAKGGSTRTPLLFVHGAYVGAWCWEANFLPWFAGRGYDAHALSLRGHGASPGRERLDELGLADYAEDVAQALAGLPSAPVLIGHSMGALVVQKVLETHGVPAAVLACPVPAYGLMPSSFSLAFTRPALFAQVQSLAAGGRVSPAVLGEALFAGPLDAARLAEYYGRMQRESRRALLDMAGFGLPQPWRMKRPPLLALGAERDVLIEPALVASGARMLGAEYRLLPGLGHAVMLDARWESAAEAILAWLEEQGL